MVFFRVPKSQKPAIPKFAASSEPGVFFGYDLQPGGRWRGDFYVSRVADLRVIARGEFSGHLRVFRVKEVHQDQEKPLHFPLKQFYDEARSGVSLEWGGADPYGTNALRTRVIQGELRGEYDSGEHDVAGAGPDSGTASV